MNIKIDIAQLLRILHDTPADQNIMLSGAHGIGKSEIVTQYFTEHGKRVVTLFLGQMSDPGDLIGLPDKSEGRTVFLPPYWWPIDGEPIVLFLDELNRARPELLQTVMDLTLNRKLAGRPLPAGSQVIAAINEGDQYQLTDLDPALVSRFNIYRFEPSPEEWIIWAKKNELDDRVVEFIANNKAWLDCNPKNKVIDTGIDKQPDRRAWKRVSDMLKGKPNLEKEDTRLLAGVVGIAAAHKFMEELPNGKKISGADLLNNYDWYIIQAIALPIHESSMLNEDIFQYLQTTNITNPATIGHNLSAYVKELASNNKGEALASFASNVTSGYYKKAITFITAFAPDILPLLMKYISSFKK